MPRFNRNWRAGVERLVREQPYIATSWLDADHGLVFTHIRTLAEAGVPPARVRELLRADEEEFAAAIADI
ncbi:hypothetical protein AB0J28_39860, partial [Streptosporangium canum]